MNPTVGRIVHYVLPAGSPWAGQHRPAMVVQVCQGLDHETSPGMSNLAVFKGQSGDFYGVGSSLICGGHPDNSHAVVTVGSVVYSEEPRFGTWHWPEREPA